jgi:hypothetical protein
LQQGGAIVFFVVKHIVC